jgi:hypothetical protein
MWHAWETKGKSPLERPRRRWEDGIRMDLREIGCGIGYSWLRIGTGEYDDEPSGSGATELVYSMVYFTELYYPLS